jgi:hypothetical protein
MIVGGPVPENHQLTPPPPPLKAEGRGGVRYWNADHRSERFSSTTEICACSLAHHAKAIKSKT